MKACATMKKVLLLICMLLFVMPATAQNMSAQRRRAKMMARLAEAQAAQDTSSTATVLQEEFSETGTPQPVLNSAVDSVTTDASSTPQTTPNSTPETKDKMTIDDKEEKEKQAEKEEGKRRIVMYIDQVESTLTASRDMSFCFGTLKVLNEMKRPVVSLQAVVTYGDISLTTKFSNIAGSATQSQDITLMGSACESITSIPTIQITSCVAPDMSEQQCKGRFVFDIGG